MHKIIIFFIAITTVVGLSSCSSTSTNDTGAYQYASTAHTPLSKKNPTTRYTVAENNAIEAANSYLEVSPFSRNGLIEQLSSQSGDTNTPLPKPHTLQAT